MESEELFNIGVGYVLYYLFVPPALDFWIILFTFFVLLDLVLVLMLPLLYPSQMTRVAFFHLSIFLRIKPVAPAGRTFSVSYKDFHGKNIKGALSSP